MKVPAFVYTIACATSVASAGFSGEYLSRNLPESHFSCSGLFVGIGFICVAVHFGFRAIQKFKQV